MLSSSLRVAAAVLVVAATALPATAAPAGEPSASPAAQAGTAGRASAVTVEVDLDVSLLNKAVDVPVNVSLNKVESPARREGSVLTALVEGVDQQGPVTLVRADVGKSATKVDDKGATASVELVNADVHAPGLPLTALLGLEALSAEVTCPVDGQPTAEVVAPAKLTVLGRPVAVGLYGPTKVDVPGVGKVSVEFSGRTTTSTTAAASALDVQVELDPLSLNVAKVSGRITVASVSCEKPAAPAPSPTASTPPPAPTSPTTTAATTSGPAVQPAGSGSKAARAVPQGATETGEHLAATGSSGVGPLVAGAAVLLVGGAAAVLATRRRATRARRH
ncbi:SCO1860 family LAETG-anchored protein [Kitasatospora sp. NPDC057223]|uniref:SCO1860 family LAETG-anchored protein n=1 Tax=Kitasatospora sp. NPDC057223 TaxID=3346055 RepID=UPI00362710CF